MLVEDVAAHTCKQLAEHVRGLARMKCECSRFLLPEYVCASTPTCFPRTFRYTKQLAEALGEGMATVLPAANVRVLAMNETDVTRDVLEWADGIMIGYVVLPAEHVSDTDNFSLSYTVTSPSNR